MTVKEYNNAVREYGDQLFRFILKSIRDRERANDIVQDSFEKLWMQVTETEASTVKSWLFTTAYNRMIDVIRKDSRLVMIEYYDDASLMENDTSGELNEVLHKALERLPAQQRAVILLRDYEGYSYQEISKITGLTEAQVKVYIYRGRVSMRNYLVKTGQTIYR